MVLEDIVKEKLQLIMDNGTMEKLIEDQVTATCKSIVTDLFRDYSEFGKSLKKTLTEKMEVSLESIALPTYTHTVCQIIEESMVGILEDQKQKVLSTVKALLQVPEKKEWKLSEIVNKYRESLYEDKELVLEVQDIQYSSRRINVGEKVEKSYSSYSTNTQTYAVRLLLDKENKVLNAWYDGKTLDIRKSKVYDHAFEGFIMQLWANDCTIELDEDDAEYEATRDLHD